MLMAESSIADCLLPLTTTRVQILAGACEKVASDLILGNAFSLKKIAFLFYNSITSQKSFEGGNQGTK